MAVKTCTVNGKPWYKGGDGICHIYTMGDKEDRQSAKDLAMADDEKMTKQEIEQPQIQKSDKTMKIIKTDNGFNTVLFVALTPEETDRNWDVITVEEITKTAHDFVRNLTKKAVNVDHQDDTEIETAEFVESFIAPVDIAVGLETIPEWSWVVGIKFDDTTYQAIKDGDFVGISIEWYGNREQVA